MKCSDCGSKDYTPSKRYDVCTDCLDLRCRIIKAAEVGQIDMDEFRQIQKVLASCTGKAANVMRRVLEAKPEKPPVVWHGD